MSSEPLVFIGLGSEWFWSLAQFVVVATSLVGIYRQVRLQASAAAIQQIDTYVKDYGSELMTRHTLDIELAIRDGVAPEEIPYGAASAIADFWEGIGYLVREGHIDRKLFREAIGNGPQWWWAALAPWTQTVRAEAGPEALVHFEWLAQQLGEDERKAGGITVFDEAHIAKTVGKRIENDRGRLRNLEQIRSVIVRQEPATTAGIEGPTPRQSPEPRKRRSGRRRPQEERGLTQ